MLVSYKNSGTNREYATLESDVDTIDRARELVVLFSGVSLDTLRTMLSTDAGRLAYSVLINSCDNLPVKELVDELMANWISHETEKAFVTRQALLNELEDVLRAKSITPYRRSRINKALKRACIKCNGSGKEVRKIDLGRDVIGKRTVRHEIDSRSPDCTHCKGSGINPKDVDITVGEVIITKAELEQLYDDFH